MIHLDIHALIVAVIVLAFSVAIPVAYYYLTSQRKINGIPVIKDRITLPPREIMRKLLAIHGIHVDPSYFSTSMISLRQCIDKARVIFTPKYDCFISYRKDSDFDLAEKIYLTLKNDGINAYLDRYCLAHGENWKGEFLKALRTSRCFVPLISCAGLRSVRDIHVDHSFDNLLLEFEKYCFQHCASLCYKHSTLEYTVYWCQTQWVKKD